jgi:hypothetical protein
MISTTTFHTQLDIAEKRVHDYIDAMVYQWELREKAKQRTRTLMEIYEETGILIQDVEMINKYSKQLHGHSAYHIDLKKFISESSN